MNKNKRQMTISVREVQASVRKPVALDQKASTFRDRRKVSRSKEKIQIRRGQWD